MNLVNRAIRKLKEYSFLDGCRKVIFFLLNYCGIPWHLFRKVKFYFYTKCWPGSIIGTVYFSSVCNHVKLGELATVYPYTVFELSENAHLEIGKNFTFSYGAVIACFYSVTIGDFVMVGEYSSIRDTTHNHDNFSVPYCKQGDKSEKIIIGNNVWIGRGCIILPGTIIEDGVIIGANSVVKGRLKAFSMYAGAPLKMIKEMKVL